MSLTGLSRPPPPLAVLRRSSHWRYSRGCYSRPLLLFLNSTWLRHMCDLRSAGWLWRPQILLKSSEFSTTWTWRVLSTLTPKMIHIWLWNVFLRVRLNISEIQKPPKNSNEGCQFIEKAGVRGGGYADLPDTALCVAAWVRTWASASSFTNMLSCVTGHCTIIRCSRTTAFPSSTHDTPKSSLISQKT